MRLLHVGDIKHRTEEEHEKIEKIVAAYNSIEQNDGDYDKTKLEPLNTKHLALPINFVTQFTLLSCKKETLALTITPVFFYNLLDYFHT
ncbi:unnamed protein product [Blepharisma stoltei]|uniref:Uncharacterized protein n=1 Tax=Blepharisma stoltei TaxID=1481888 RepID=A0AAU9JQH7_9CILI|nr:unnamed protein product [Blepharisma stoltei]